MKSTSARLTGADGIGLPDPRQGWPIGNRPPSSDKKTAAPAGPRRGGRQGLREATAKPLRKECRKALCLTSVGLTACFTDEGHFYGWEVSR